MLKENHTEGVDKMNVYFIRNLIVQYGNIVIDLIAKTVTIL